MLNDLNKIAGGLLALHGYLKAPLSSGGAIAGHARKEPISAHHGGAGTTASKRAKIRLLASLALIGRRGRA